MKTFGKVVIGLGVALMLGCQGNDPFDRESNPYPDDIKNYTPEQPEATEEQTVKVKTFDVSAKGEVASTKVLHFVAGENGEYTIDARSFVDQTQFNLKPHNFPEGAQLTPVQGSPGSWILTWTPNVSVIPAGQMGVDIDVSIEFVIAEGTSPRAANAHAPFEKMTDFRLTVRHSDKQPVITTANQLDETTQLSEDSSNINFNLTVVDPMSNGDHPPELLKRFNFEDSNTSLPGNFALRSTSQPTFQGSGTWIFPMTLDLDLLGDHYRRNGENGKRINVNISVMAESSVTSNESPVWSKTISVQLKNKESN